MGSTVKPGQSAAIKFPYHMGPGMAGKHHFQITVSTNDPEHPTLTFDVYANSVE